MTPPRPPAPTAAELREATIQMHCDSGGCDSVRGGPPGSHDSVGCHLAGMLDDLMAAVRAEALHLAMGECEAEAALNDSEKTGLDAGSACRNCRDRIEWLVSK